MTAQDKVEIQELTARYALAMDQGDPSAWIDTWAIHGVWEGARGVYQGHEQLRQLLVDLGTRIQNKRHVISNSIIEVNGLEAAQTCYMLIIDPKTETKIVASATYQDRLQKVNGRWKFTNRIMKLDG